MLHDNNDLINKIGKKTSADGSAQAEPSNQSDTAGKSETTANASETVKAATVQTGAENGSAEPKAASKTEEPSGSEDMSWTLESALKEVKKLRDENKSQRHKYSEKIEEFQKQTEDRFKTLAEQVQEAEAYKKQLEELKSKEEDKKRTLEEKLSHREAKLAEIETLYKVQQQELAKQLDQYKVKVSTYEADREAEVEAYRKRVDEMLGTVPDLYREHAQLIVKGAGDPKDALIALNEAKLKGLFEEKKVFVNHSVPGASDGARATKDQLDNAAKQQRAKMSSNQLIGEAIKQIRGGQTNSAFKKR